MSKNSCAIILRRVVTLLLSFCFAFTLAGCGKSTQDAGTTQDTSYTNEATEEVELFSYLESTNLYDYQIPYEINLLDLLTSNYEGSIISRYQEFQQIAYRTDDNGNQIAYYVTPEPKEDSRVGMMGELAYLARDMYAKTLNMCNEKQFSINIKVFKQDIGVNLYFDTKTALIVDVDSQGKCQFTGILDGQMYFDNADYLGDESVKIVIEQLISSNGVEYVVDLLRKNLICMVINSAEDGDMRNINRTMPSSLRYEAMDYDAIVGYQQYITNTEYNKLYEDAILAGEVYDPGYKYETITCISYNKDNKIAEMQLRRDKIAVNMEEYINTLAYSVLEADIDYANYAVPSNVIQAYSEQHSSENQSVSYIKLVEYRDNGLVYFIPEDKMILPTDNYGENYLV